MKRTLVAVGLASLVVVLLVARYGRSKHTATTQPVSASAVERSAAKAVIAHRGHDDSEVDVVSDTDGVEITGVVSDITGGPVVGARVRASIGGGRGTTPPAFTDANGVFALRAPHGSVTVTARADGYVADSREGHAPGRFALLLTPESSLSGIVIDARTEQPVHDADVFLELEGRPNVPLARTDERGAFHVTGLVPGRYAPTVSGPAGYGRAEPVLVGLAEHVTGVVVRVIPTRRIAGTIVHSATREPCTRGGALVHDVARGRPTSNVLTRVDTDGTLAFDVPPGTYTIEIYCLDATRRDSYPPIVVAHLDIEGLVWEVDPAAVLSGRITTTSGQPVANAIVDATLGADAHSAETDRDGRYEMQALKPGPYHLRVTSSAGVADPAGYLVVTKAGTPVTKDIVLEDGGRLIGTVVDEQGNPVVGVNVLALPDAATALVDGPLHTTDGSGAFSIAPLRAGTYRVLAMRGLQDTLRTAGSGDAAVHDVKIDTGKTTSVKLVVEAMSGTIAGIVVDADGKPVSDALVSGAREEEEAASEGGRPTMTDVDGTFVLTDLAPGTYTLRAARNGRNNAALARVAAGTKNARLQIKRGGAIEGVVTGSQSDVSITIDHVALGFVREERFAGGRFVMRDVPAGRLRVTARAANGQSTIELDLAEGENKLATLAIQPFVTLTGRVVASVTKAPIAGMRVLVQRAHASPTAMSDQQSDITDASGRFSIRGAPRGLVSIQGFDFRTAFRVSREIQGADTTIDIGDIDVIVTPTQAD